MRPYLMLLLLFASVFNGCLGDDAGPAQARLTVDAESEISAATGQVLTIPVDSNVDWTAHRSDGMFIVDERGVFRDAYNWTFAASHESLQVLILDTATQMLSLSITAGSESWSANITHAKDGMMLVDWQRAFETIDMLTTDHNNRWCASASLHEGGANYERSAEAMAAWMLEMGFDHAEVTDYADDPNQKNVVGYKWGLKYPDEWIVIGGHFDVAYAFTPPGGGTSEGANDDTSGSTVSLEMAQALASRQWDHTVVAALWACEEEGLLGSSAFVSHLPEEVSIKAYMNFDMVSLNYPITPPPGYGPYDLSIATAGASDDNQSKMLEWLHLIVQDELAYAPTSANEIEWESAESCASDHCSFFSEGYATFNFFSAGGDASFWQEWHSGTDNLEFMVQKAGGEDGLASGFNTLVWISLGLFIHIDNTGDDFQGRFASGE